MQEKEEEKKDPNSRVEISPSPAEDAFWIEFGKDSVKKTLDGLDDRAKYMITTCASLIVVHFGLLVGFNMQGYTFNIMPEFFIAIAAALFAVSFYPISRTINMQSPDSIQKAYNCWLRWKLNGHRFGFAFFITGLFIMALTNLIRTSQ